MLLIPFAANAGEQLEFDVVKLLSEAPSVLRKLPPGKTIVQDGVEYKAYNAKEYADVVLLEDDLNWFFPRFFSLAKAYSKQKIELEISNERLGLCKSNAEIMKADLGYYRTRLDDEKKLSLSVDKLRKIEQGLYIGLIVIEGIVIAALGAEVAVKEYAP